MSETHVAAGTEHEVIFTGIGGQGIQLMAKILAEAATQEGKHVMLFGVYSGMMRGGSSESTVVIGDGEIEAPPIIPHCWCDRRHASARARRPGAQAATGRSAVRQPDAGQECAARRCPIRRAAGDATRRAGGQHRRRGDDRARRVRRRIGHRRVGQRRAAMRAALPSHRRQRADENAHFLTAGAEHMRATAAATSSAGAAL